MRCGLLGRVLGHSYSPMIHGMLGQYSYDLFPTEPESWPQADRVLKCMMTIILSLSRL